MKKTQVRDYKIKKGLGQISFDLFLTIGMKAFKIEFNHTGMIIYSVIKGGAYLLWDVYMFNKEVKEDEDNDAI
jgi:hypothetical protein